MALKRFKVSQFKGDRVFGIAAKNLAELKEKIVKQFELNVELKEIAVCLEDWTTIENEDYFKLLPNGQTVTVVPIQDVPLLVRRHNLLISLRQLMKDVQKGKNENTNGLRSIRDKNFLRIIKDEIRQLESRARLSTRQEDPDWFIGCPSKATTKEEYLRSLAKGRINSYLLDFKERWKQYVNKETVDEAMKQWFENCVARMKEFLSEHQYYSCYFDRRDLGCGHRYCDGDGTFSCQGPYNQERCDWQHTINPYDNEKSRIEFSNWNLDHVTERHVVIKAFVEAAVRSRNNLSEERLKGYLFNKENLEFVYKLCHVMGAHTGRTVDYNEFLGE